MKRYQWSELNHLQIGRYAEYFVKMEFTMYGFQVYTTEVDDRGIDFVVRHETKPFREVQVKSCRGLNYIFITKGVDKVIPRDRDLALVIFDEGKSPALYLIPMDEWESPNKLLVDHNYSDQHKSKPEWGINLSVKNMPLLSKYRFDATIELFISQCSWVGSARPDSLQLPYIAPAASRKPV